MQREDSFLNASDMDAINMVLQATPISSRRKHQHKLVRAELDETGNKVTPKKQPKATNSEVVSQTSTRKTTTTKRSRAKVSKAAQAHEVAQEPEAPEEPLTPTPPPKEMGEPHTKKQGQRKIIHHETISIRMHIPNLVRWQRSQGSQPNNVRH
jgi:hypothetical protein